MSMSEPRLIKFGKYKGESIIWLIASHIGYIMWCLNNIKNFHLTGEEQSLYDAISIAIIRRNSDEKHPMDASFPVEELKLHIMDKDSLMKLDSPFVITQELKTKFYFDKADDTLKNIVTKYNSILIEKERYTSSDESIANTIRDLAKQVIQIEENNTLEESEKYIDFDFFRS